MPSHQMRGHGKAQRGQDIHSPMVTQGRPEGVSSLTALPSVTHGCGVSRSLHYTWGPIVPAVSPLLGTLNNYFIPVHPASFRGVGEPEFSSATGERELVTHRGRGRGPGLLVIFKSLNQAMLEVRGPVGNLIVFVFCFKKCFP